MVKKVVKKPSVPLAKCPECGCHVRVNARLMTLYSHTVSPASTQACRAGGAGVGEADIVTSLARLAEDRELAKARFQIAATLRDQLAAPKPKKKPARRVVYGVTGEDVSVRALGGGLPDSNRRRH